MSSNEVRLAPVSAAIARDRDSLLAALGVIDNEGWDGETATALLTFVREEIARPLAVDVGLRGLAASQAEASAWQAAWIAMTKPSIRRAASPWGVIWRAAKRAVLGEVVAAQCASSHDRAWHWRRAGQGHDAVRVVISLDALLNTPWEPTTDEHADKVGAALAATHGALIAAGWNVDESAKILDAFVDLPPVKSDARSILVGWRAIADKLGLPPWQARRLYIAIRGAADWPGAIARALKDGPKALEAADIQAALRATRTRRHRSPILAARMASGPSEPRPQRAAS